MVTPFLFLVTPGKVFEKIKLRPQWVVPCIVVVCGLVVKTVVENRWEIHPFILQIQTFYLDIIIVSIMVIILWAAISAFVFLSMVFMNLHPSVAYKSIFSIVSYCGLIILLGEICNYLLINTTIVDRMLYTIPKRFPIGLDIFTLGSNPHPALAIMLHAINPFSIWYFTLLSNGLSIVANLSKTKARMLSFIMWLIAVGLAVSVLLITGETSLRIKL